MESRRRRGESNQEGSTERIPRVDIDTVRPPGADAAEDASSAETVVRAIPTELLRAIDALRPARVPALDAIAAEEPAPAPDLPLAVLDEENALSLRPLEAHAAEPASDDAIEASDAGADDRYRDPLVAAEPTPNVNLIVVGTLLVILALVVVLALWR